ncbi:MAG: calcium/sodium antiporter [Methanomicrobiales archaeon]|nr:calcium/sodium antiporter [Methanomicrobiales archaeon]
MSPYILLFLGLLAMVVCGNWLVSGSVQLARHFKISTLIVGLTIVAYVTSTPEIFISVGAALEGAHDIALGNVIGSNIANIGCILAIVALIYPLPIRNRAIGFDIMMMFLVTFLLLFFGYNGMIGFYEGICLLSILVAYTVGSIYKSRKNNVSKETLPATMKPLQAVFMIALAVVGLYFSAGWFVGGAREVALLWGVSERVIGVSVVAVGTSTPELMTSLIAALKKEADLSVGNIIGSNFFNIAGVLGITTAISSIKVSDHAMFLSDMTWLFGITIALLVTMLPLSKGKISRLEASLLLSVFALYIFILYTS